MATTNLNNITYTTSRCVARFFPFNERGTLSEDDTQTAMDASEFIEDDSIVSCSISRDKSSAGDVFELILKPKLNYYNLAKPGDWVIIYLDDINNIDIRSLKGVKCIGNIDRVAKNTVTNNDGTVVTTFTIHGSGWGKVLETTEMFYNPYAPPDQKSIFAQIIGFSIQGSPFDFVDGYLNIFLGNAKKEELSDILFPVLISPQLYKALKGEEYSKGAAPSFNDVMIRKFDENTKEGFAQFRDVSRIMSGSLWNTLQQCSNAIVNELFTDIRDGKPTLVFRKIPLTQQLRQNLVNAKLIQLSETNIVNTNLGTSDHELFNYLSIFSTDSLVQDISWFLAGQFQGKLPIIAKGSTKRFGLRRIDRNTEFAFTKAGDIGFDLLLRWAEELAEYWFNYYHFENGTIEVVGRTDFEIGTFIKIVERGHIYMVEGISWDWTYQQPIVTSLTVTTGLKTDLSFIDADRDPSHPLGTTVYERPADKKFATAPSNLISKATLIKTTSASSTSIPTNTPTVFKGGGGRFGGHGASGSW